MPGPSADLAGGESLVEVVGSCGVAGCIDATACNYNEDATFDDGTCVFAEPGFDCDGNCLSGTAATLTANDSYGDGWNGAVMNVTIDGELFDPLGLGFTYTMASFGVTTGATEDVTVCLPDGILAGTCVQIEVSSGSYNSEISWSLSVFGAPLLVVITPLGELGVLFQDVWMKLHVIITLRQLFLMMLLVLTLKLMLTVKETLFVMTCYSHLICMI